MVHSIPIPIPIPISISLPAAHGRWRKTSAVRSVLLAASLLAALAAQAQPAAKAAKPDPLDPLDPTASVPALRYVSSFSKYRLLGDEKPASWRDANDTVTRIGGWRAYAREAQQPDLAPAANAAPAPTTAPAAPAPATNDKAKIVPVPAGHGGHKMP